MSVALKQTARSPRVLRTHLPAYARRIYVAVFRASIGLFIYWPAHPTAPPLSVSCSSGPRFAYGFLQIPPHDGHPCRSANTSPCRVCRGLSPPSECALPGAPTKRARGRACPLQPTTDDQGPTTGFLRRFDQLHSSVAGAVQHHHLAFRIAKDEHVPVAEVAFLNRFLQRHGTKCDCFVRMRQMNFGGFRHSGKLVHHHRHRGCLSHSDGRLHLILPGFAVPLFV